MREEEQEKSAPSAIEMSHNSFPEQRQKETSGTARTAFSLFLISIVALSAMSAYELLNQNFFPAFTFKGIHIMSVLLVAFTAPAISYLMLGKYRDLVKKGAGETAGRERMEKALRQNEELYKAVVENVADGIAITVGTERVLVNRAFLKIHGLNESSRVIDHPFDQFIVPEDKEAAKERVRARQRGESLEGMAEYRIQKPDGELRTLQASVGMINYMGRPGTLAVLRDITEIKKAETRILELNQELEQHVQGLETANRDLEAFNSMVSHDLRTPLVTIQGFSRRLWERCGENLDEKCRYWLTLIRSGADRMGHLIEDLLAYSRLGREALQFSKISMGKLADNVIQDLKPIYPEGGATVFPLPDAFGDERMVRQLLSNLLSNAFKFSSHGQRPVVEVRGMQRAEENVYSVKDNGIGFDMKEKERMFDPFHRLHTRDEFEGTGVGLAIVKRIALLHGGRVWAEGLPDQGATFYLALPKEGHMISERE